MNIRQRGMALIVVLMILAIMAGLAAEMTLRFQIDLRRSGSGNQRLQQQWQLQLAEKRALKILKQDLVDNSKYTSLTQYWAQPQEIELDEKSRLNWQIYDGQACYNVNALANVPADSLEDSPFSAEIFKSLLQSYDVEPGKAEEIIDSIADYIDSDEKPRRRGAENEFYRTRKPVSFSADRLLLSLSELKQIKGMTPALYEEMASQLCVLPTTDLKINVSTLTRQQAPLVSALYLGEISVSNVQRLFTDKANKEWSNSDALIKALDKTLPLTKEKKSKIKTVLTSHSNYFDLHSQINNDNQFLSMSTHVYFSTKKNEFIVLSRRLTVTNE